MVMKTKLFCIFLLFTAFTLSAENYLKTVNVTVSGTLSSLISSQERGVITHLTVTGNIDARDVKFMRDDMGILMAIDMGGATVMSYTGSGGTIESSTTYPAGEMPEYSFKYPQWSSGKFSLQTIVLPNNLTSVGRFAFAYCSALQGKINIPGSVTNIGERAFYYCDNITGLVLGGSVVNIGDAAFALCKKLTGEIGIPASVRNIADAVFSDCNLIKTLTLGANVENIGNFAFSSCYEISGNIVFPSSLKRIGSNCFNGCGKITGLTFGNSLTEIGEAAFISCTGISGNLVFPNTLTTIGQSAFKSCALLTGLSFGNAIQAFPEFCFSDCSGIKKVEINNHIPPVIDNFAFFNLSKSNCTVYVPVGSLQAYKASNWNAFPNILESNFNSSVNDVSSNEIRIFNQESSIIIQGEIFGEQIDVYSVDGKLIKALKSTSNSLKIDLYSNAVFIVLIGNKLSKSVFIE